MTVFGVAIIRDDADIAPRTVANMVEQVDQVIVIDHGSTDGTREALEKLPIDLRTETERDYRQGEMTTRLADEAFSRGADWVVPFDGDEWWYSPHGTIKDVLGEGNVAQAPLFDHRPTAQDNRGTRNPIKRMGWRNRKPLPIHKVAVRPIFPVIFEGNHQAEFGRAELVEDLLIVRHFPYRSPEQMVQKVLKGRGGRVGHDRRYSAHFFEYGDLYDAGGEEALHEVFYKHFHFKEPERNRDLIFDPVP